MASHSCVSGCGRFLASSDGHDRCPSCLGYQHAEAALVDESCSHCGNMTIAMLRSRSPLPCPVLAPPIFRGLLRLMVRVTTAATWSWPQESGASRLRPCQAREAPGQAVSLRRATRSLWILLFRRW